MNIIVILPLGKRGGQAARCTAARGGMACRSRLSEPRPLRRAATKKRREPGTMTENRPPRAASPPDPCRSWRTARAFDETSGDLFTSGFVYEGGRRRGRVQQHALALSIFALGNPTVSMFERACANLRAPPRARHRRHGRGVRVAHVPAQGGRSCRPSDAVRLVPLHRRRNLPRRVETVLVDARDLDQWKKALSKPTTAVFLESPSNPQLRIVDIAAVCDMSPWWARAACDADAAAALQLGADVSYSATAIDGQAHAGESCSAARIHRQSASALMRHTGRRSRR